MRPCPPNYEVQQGPGLLVRALWFMFIGWWLTGIVSAIAWLAMITIIGLPLGIWLINRIPTVITLRPRTREVQRMVDSAGFVYLVPCPSRSCRGGCAGSGSSSSAGGRRRS